MLNNTIHQSVVIHHFEWFFKEQIFVLKLIPVFAIAPDVTQI